MINDGKKRCLRCSRELRDDLSVSRGYGSTCYRKLLKSRNSKQRKLFDIVEMQIDVGKKAYETDK